MPDEQSWFRTAGLHLHPCAFIKITAIARTNYGLLGIDKSTKKSIVIVYCLVYEINFG